MTTTTRIAAVALALAAFTGSAIAQQPPLKIGAVRDEKLVRVRVLGAQIYFQRIAIADDLNLRIGQNTVL